MGRLQWTDGELKGKNFLMGDTFAAADASLFVVQSWGKHVGVDGSGLPDLSALDDRVGKRAAVQEALCAEGLMK